jgi:hypothetical protein
VVGYDNIAISRVVRFATDNGRSNALTNSGRVPVCPRSDGASTTSGARKMPDNNSKKSYIAQTNA